VTPAHVDAYHECNLSQRALNKFPSKKQLPPCWAAVAVLLWIFQVSVGRKAALFSYYDISRNNAAFFDEADDS
jgi:hypothetical protein